MWATCCVLSRKRAITENKHGKTAQNIINAPKAHCDESSLISSPDNERKITVDLTANGFQTLRERRSLPDVVIASATVQSVKCELDQRASLQIDKETGRRPTLDVETTARLAEAESMGLDDLTEKFTKSVVPSTKIQTNYRSKSLGTTQLTNQVGWLSNQASRSAASTSHPIHVPERSRSEKHSKKNSLIRFSTLKGIHKHLRKLSLIRFTKPTDGEFSGGHGSSEALAPESSERISKDSKLLEEDEEEEEVEHGSLGDKLGHLPPKMRGPRGSRFNTAYGLCDISGNPLTKFQLSVVQNPSFSQNSMNNNPRIGNIRRGSLCLFSQVDEPIVTPFAQILASLRRVRANFILLTNVSSSRDSRFGTSHAGLGEEQTHPYSSVAYDQFKTTAAETLEELEWCLERLENIQTHRSVSDMASSKFKKMLNKELSQFTDGGRNAKQISEYICSTFLDSKEVEGSSGVDAANENPCENDSTWHATTPDEQQPVQLNSQQLQQQQQLHQISETGTNHNCTNNDTGRLQQFQGANQSKGKSDMGPTNSIPTNSNETVQLFGVVSDHPEQLKAITSSSLDVWGLDVFALAKLTPNPLTCVFYTILQKRGLIKRFSLSEVTIIRYMNAVEENYRAVPYHNRVHAADVVQSTHVLLNAQALSSVFTDLEVLAVLFACAVHDVDHPGLTNQYLINTNDQLAIMYNDASVLENHHLAIAFQLLNRPGCDMLESLGKKQRLSLRRMAIDMVLATDMSKHMSLLADLKTMVETKKVAGSGILTLDNYSDRMQILQNMIHCADLSNPTKPLELYRQWNARIMEELFRQGDCEREQGLDLSPMCDRNTASVEKTQVSFIDYIVHPLWETWSELVHPDAQKILEALEDNREWYLSQIVEDSIPEHKGDD